MLTARNETALQTVVKECEQSQGHQHLKYKVECKTAEGTDWDQNKALIERTVEIFGRIDVLILCAGVSAHQMFADMNDLSMLR